MLFAATEPGSDEVLGYFDLNFAARDNGEYRFMWPNGRIKTLAVHRLRSDVAPVEAPVAALDIASGFVMVRDA